MQLDSDLFSSAQRYQHTTGILRQYIRVRGIVICCVSSNSVVNTSENHKSKSFIYFFNRKRTSGTATMLAEESIYSLIPHEEAKPEKQPRYTSRFRGTVKVETKTNKAPSKTMGPAKVELKKPEEFVKKHSKEPQLPEKQTFKYPDDDKRRPAVPKRDEKPLMGLKSNKNFVNTNAVENIMSVPKKPAANFVDTVNGATHPLTPSGLMPKYVKKKGYGEVPGYLQKRNEEVKRAQEEYDEYIKEHYRRGAMKCLTDEERKAIMDGLKKNWEDIHHQYQGLSVVTDTAPKKARKERMEAEMKQLERDIELLEKHKVIYISNH